MAFDRDRLVALWRRVSALSWPVLVAHRGLAGVFRPLFGGLAWLYDVAFLLLALPAIAIVAVRLYTSLDPAADLIADRVAGEDDRHDGT